MSVDAAQTTVVILNWRTPDLTLRAVGALLDQGVPASRIVVVDNASRDGSVESIRRCSPHLTVLGLDRNVGFAAGNNLGSAELAGDAYLFVNSDAFASRPGSVERLLAGLDDPEVGIVVPRLLNEDGSLQPSVVPFSTPLSELVRASGLSRFVPNSLQPRLGTHWDHSSTRYVEAAVGAVILIRAEAWSQLGGFDESSFMYAEDHDLLRRSAGLGWRTLFVADAEFVHLGSASATQQWSDPARARRVASAEAAMVRSHLGLLTASATIALMIAGVGTRALWRCLRGDRDAARTQMAWMRGYLDGFGSVR